MKLFRERIRQKIANPFLQMALDGNSARRLQGRAAAFTSLPDVEARRTRAAAMRNAVIAHLEEYLAQFTSRLQANGIQVHRAATAADAVRLVLQISAEHQPGSLLFAKSKSMVSEEVELNHALEAAGHRVVETDLGEYIVQLRGERPSHIITPAAHLRRQDVGELFQQKLGIPYTEDIPTLTNTARRVLRQVFLTADVGVSGVNFGVAETGSLCIVTNEGNGRMVTTLPRLHIALMGMERLVPDMDSLALALSLLPRSATGQTMSVYTQLINAPLPGQQRHLILLDNGRSALRTSPLRDSLRCIRCGACLNACPAFREMGGHAYGSVYPGPIGSVISPGLFGASFSEMAYACSLCGACEEVCPVKIPLPNLLVRVRAGQLPQPAQPGAPLPAALKAGISAFAWFATHPRWFALAQKVAGLLTQGRILSLPPQTGWGLSRDIATPAAQPFRERFQKAKEESRNSRVENGDLRVGNRDSDSEQPTTKNESPITNNQSLIQRFASELQAVSAELIRTSAAGLPAALQTWLTQNDIRTVYAGDEIALPSGITRHNQPDAQAGISAALLGIAETGSLLLQESADSPLAASLLPPIHLAILPASQLFTTLEQALAHPQTRLAPALSLVTGPSRTADIEMTLTIGVHGPGRLVVFLLEEE